MWSGGGGPCRIPRVVSLAPKLAQSISAATRLPLLAVPLFAAVGFGVAGTGGLLWAALCVSLTSGLSLLYLAYLTRSGAVRDPRSIPRAERVGPLRVVAALHAGAFLLVYGLGGPAPLTAALLSYAIATLLFALLTPLINLSLHAAGGAGTAVCPAYVFGPWGAPRCAPPPPPPPAPPPPPPARCTPRAAPGRRSASRTCSAPGDCRPSGSCRPCSGPAGAWAGTPRPRWPSLR